MDLSEDNNEEEILEESYYILDYDYQVDSEVSLVDKTRWTYPKEEDVIEMLKKSKISVNETVFKASVLEDTHTSLIFSQNEDSGEVKYVAKAPENVVLYKKKEDQIISKPVPAKRAPRLLGAESAELRVLKQRTPNRKEGRAQSDRKENGSTLEDLNVEIVHISEDEHQTSADNGKPELQLNIDNEFLDEMGKIDKILNSRR
eukprot:CAMPEP_0114988570 /NCGR_PEP_ID=MMETSP0216-20121206/9679_1 /TAXON_ID=223996 /ORGANISM="Protocruzia adherens, Strain Boccale" /LENGTH=201 /DNA_ID=CAMNT_0002351379 /DNA_START=119 /DNA_END=724 /DNA_ORIENTATION=+